MVRYTFEVVAEINKTNHVHSEAMVKLNSAEVESIIAYMVENGDDLNYPEFHNQHPELEDKFYQASIAELPKMLESYYYSMEDLEAFWYEFPLELRDIAEAELGHPLRMSKQLDEPEHSEESDAEFEQWIKEHADDIIAGEEENFQERQARFDTAMDNDSSSNKDVNTSLEEESSIDYQDFALEIYDVAMAMEEFKDMLVDITFTAYSRFDDDEHEEHYIVQIGSCTQWCINLIHPLDLNTQECFCGSMGTPVHEIKIQPVSEQEAEIWRREAHKHSDLCRHCDKEDWIMDHPEFEGVDYEQEKAYRYIDSNYDLINAVIDAAQRYDGDTEEFIRL